MTIPSSPIAHRPFLRLHGSARTLVAVLFLGLLVRGVGHAAAPTFAPCSEPPPTAKLESPVERVAVIGASASAGFNAYFWRLVDDRPVRDSITLAKLLRAASHDRLVVIDLGTAQFFTNPAGIGELTIDRALRAEPDLVVGIDFLFWFCYGWVGPEAGRMRTDDERLAMLDKGLSLLDRVVEQGLPLVVGDIPDMSAASGGVLQPVAVPTEELRLEANRRIRRWVDERPSVELFSLDGLQRLLESEEPIVVEGVELSPDERGRLLQLDRLHPTVGGLVVIVSLLADTLERHPNLVGRLPKIERGYGANLERVTGFPRLGAQDDLDRRWWESRRESLPASGKDPGGEDAGR